MIRKQTKKWTMKDRRKIRICDMSDTHLYNTINLIKRHIKTKEIYLFNLGLHALRFIQGEMARECIEYDLDRIAEGIYLSEICYQYNNLILEQKRRRQNDL